MFRVMGQDAIAPNRFPSRTCDVCHQPTRERKPYCSEHIMTHGDYPKSLAAVLGGVAEEIERVGKVGHKAVQLDGLVVEEILAGIAGNGRLTWLRLLKDHVAFLNNASEEVCAAYLASLTKNDLVRVTHTKRGCEVVELTTKGLARLLAGRK